MNSQLERIRKAVHTTLTWLMSSTLRRYLVVTETSKFWPLGSKLRPLHEDLRQVGAILVVSLESKYRSIFIR